MIKIIKLKRTCFACPAQWEGETSDKRAVYIRYRWGHLSIRLSEVGGTVSDAVGGREIYGEEIGDGFDGLMDFAELEKLTREVLDLSGVREQEE
ncbi:unnamed protein product [marine sediment metagenome]|uniref:Uncharacterized protein n=1 Tax=marine sediment metagenome TaxID=412755 RepID=X1UTB4_9ZZZZ